MPSPLPVITLQEARDHIHDRCFRHAGGGDDTVGIELELFPVAAERGWPSAVPHALVRAALDAALPLHGGSSVTFEPGGQLELSTRPCATVDEACGALSTDLAEARAALASDGIDLVACGSDPLRPPGRVVDTPRYRAMEAFFDGDGHHGRTMMCSLAAVQVNVSLGPPDGIDDRWRLAHHIGPTLVAAFANSPWLCGELTGWKSNRLATWYAIDPTRTAPPAPRGGTAAAQYAAYALDARVMLVRRPGDDYEPVTEPWSFSSWIADGHERGWPTTDDLDYHLTTLFPPVRPKGWLEIRYLDAVPDPWWSVAAAVTSALLTDGTAADAARRAVAGTEGMWMEAARMGLAHPALARSAHGCFEAAIDALRRRQDGARLAELTAGYADCFVARGRCPADEAAALPPWPTVQTGPAWT